MKRYLSVLSLLVVATSSAAEFKQLLDDPVAYHHRRVTINGVARVEGLTFELYARPSDANLYAPADRALSISQNVNGPRHDKFDNRWVKVTGIVDAKRHGMWGYRCVIFLENVQLLRRPPAGPPHVVISGVFRNDGPQDTSVVLLDQAGKIYAEFPVPVHEVNGTGLRKGAAEVREPSGKVISRYGLLSDRDSPYLDRASHTYYYRISNGRIEGISPSKAKSWSSKANR